MHIQITKTRSKYIQHLRQLFLHENNFQFIYDKCHYYGWADVYIITNNEATIGYGAIWGTDKREMRDTIFEYYILPPWRQYCSSIFEMLFKVTYPSFIECQTNDKLLSSMLFEYAKNINTEAILFEDHFQSNFQIPGVQFGRNAGEGNKDDDAGGYLLQYEGEIVATGGFMLNYNFPYADIYMDVKENYRGKGYGSLMVQELKKEIYRIGRVPAARCNINNHASKATLLKAGFKPCGFRLKGTISHWLDD
jgi:RimJ/RimL family protein N-acetyltransferase